MDIYFNNIIIYDNLCSIFKWEWQDNSKIMASNVTIKLPPENNDNDDDDIFWRYLRGKKNNSLVKK